MTRDKKIEKGTVLITGSSGFIGKHLVRKLESLNYRTICYNSCDADITEVVFPNEKINHVFHLAALTSVPESWGNQLEYYRVNVLGTVNILQNCILHKCSMTYMSTFVYGAPKYSPIDEHHAKCPNSPYSHSKLLGESLCNFYSDNFGVPVAVLRPFNVFGPGQDSSFLIPTVVNQLIDDNKKEIHVMDLAPSRDYVYVDDVVYALIKSMGCNATFDVFNIGSGISISVQEVINIIQEESGYLKPVVEDGVSRRNEITEFCASTLHARVVLGWTPKFSFREGIREVLKEALSQKEFAGRIR